MCFGTYSPSNHWAGHPRLLYKKYFSSHVTIWLRNCSLLLHRIREDNTSKGWFYLFYFCIFGKLMSHPLVKIFHLFNLLQMTNDHRMFYSEFFHNFSCSCKRISFNDGSQLVAVTFQWLAIVLLIFKALISLAKLLEPPHCIVHSLAVSGPNVLLLRVVSAALQPSLKLNKKTAWICFLSNIISIV